MNNKTCNQHSTPTPGTLHDLVVPYRKDASFDSLRYCIRSMVKNFTSLNAIWVIGDKPEWANDQLKIISFDHHKKLKNATLAKNRNICEKLLCAALHPNISSEFLYAADDHYLLKARQLGDFKQNIVIRENMDLLSERFRDPKRRLEQTLNSWQKALWLTYDSIKAEGYSGWNFETHTPKIINKHHLIKTFASFGIGHGKLIWQTAYCNMHWDITNTQHSEQSNIKAGFYSNKKEEDIQSKLDKAVFLNHDDEGLSSALKSAIMEKFPEPSPYER